ncbi:MAG TPA: zf-HC2 domain-containing protein [Anaeromyxobacteraceae bacterium]|nr:zf-HC2 domain-containing protein [Anaeromyxobacteraceae bacterium]
MDCTEARPLLHDLRRRRLAPPLAEGVSAHLEGCEGCRRVEEEEGVLDDLLRNRLPRHGAPASLKTRLAVLEAPVTWPARPAWIRFLAPALAASLALTTGYLLFERQASGGPAVLAALTAEAVSDHLRVLASQRPLEVESGGSHQVKPWFEGKLDFAPAVPLPEVTDLRLLGGAIGYFRDRKAGVVQYSLRRHAVTLLVFRSEGLAWPRAGETSLLASSARGFNVVLWRAGDLGYALVSDVNPEELAALARRFAAVTP